MAFVWGPVLFGSDSKDKANKKNVKSKVTSSSSASSDFIEPTRSYVRKKTLASQTSWGRNPFMLGYDSKALMIEGIVWDEENPKAIINGNIFGIGDKVGVNVIVDIDQNSVIIKGESEDVKLFLGEEKQF